jgi:hypothetical protein
VNGDPPFSDITVGGISGRDGTDAENSEDEAAARSTRDPPIRRLESMPTASLFLNPSIQCAHVSVFLSLSPHFALCHSEVSLSRSFPQRVQLTEPARPKRRGTCE